MNTESDIAQYARPLRAGDHSTAVAIEMRWGLYGFTSEIVSTVLSYVAAGLPLGAAVSEATGGAS